MKTRKIVAVSFCVLAFVAVVVGLVTYFFGFGSIKDVPNVPHVEQVGGEYHLVTNYNPNYYYNFKVEKFVGDQYLAILNFSTKENNMNLGDVEEFDLDDDYRFSVCFTAENGARGKYSGTYTWKISDQFEGSVEYDKVKFEDETLTWNAVDGAEVYTYVLIDATGREILRDSISENHFSCSSLDAGQYKVYINAGVNNVQVLPSEFGEGAEFVIERQNEISNVTNEGGFLFVQCTQKVKEFQIFVNDELKLTIQAGESDTANYFLDASALLKDMDFSENKVEICSSDNGFIKASTKVQIN